MLSERPFIGGFLIVSLRALDDREVASRVHCLMTMLVTCNIKIVPDVGIETLFVA